MEEIVAAPYLRGLALDHVRKEGGSAAFVASRRLDAAAPLPAAASAVRVAADGDGGKGDDEAAFRAALRDASARAGSPFARRFLVDSSAGPLLLAAGRSPEAARILLETGEPAEGADRAPSAAVASARHPGSAVGRENVVRGKIALVTGGAQGFGEEIVRALAASGAFVYVADLNADGAEKLAAELNVARGGDPSRGGAAALRMDVADEASVEAAFETIARATGGLDLVVSNAGVLKAGSVLDQPLADFDLVARVNYVGFFLVCRAAGRMLRRQRALAPGHRTDIVQINSKSGLEGSNKNAAYAGSKFGGIGLVQSFALELVEHGVKVNAICPGNFLDGPLWSDPDRGLFVQYLRTGKVPGARTVADVRAFYEAKVPLGRGCSGADVMKALYYAVEQEYETGQAIPVTGGQVMLG